MRAALLEAGPASAEASRRATSYAGALRAAGWRCIDSIDNDGETGGGSSLGELTPTVEQTALVRGVEVGMQLLLDDEGLVCASFAGRERVSSRAAGSWCAWASWDAWMPVCARENW